VSIDPADILQPGVFGQAQAAELVAQINALPDVMPQPLKLIGAGIPTAVAVVLDDQMHCARYLAFKGHAGRAGELIEVGVTPDVAGKIADALNAIEV
jgi:hypothetical protein